MKKPTIREQMALIPRLYLKKGADRSILATSWRDKSNNTTDKGLHWRSGALSPLPLSRQASGTNTGAPKFGSPELTESFFKAQAKLEANGLGLNREKMLRKAADLNAEKIRKIPT